MLGDFVDDGVHQRLRVLNLLSKEASPVCDLLDVGLLVDATLSAIQQSVSECTRQLHPPRPELSEHVTPPRRRPMRARHGGTPSMRGRRAAAAQAPRQLAVPGM